MKDWQYDRVNGYRVVNQRNRRLYDEFTNRFILDYYYRTSKGYNWCYIGGGDTFFAEDRNARPAGCEGPGLQRVVKDSISVERLLKAERVNYTEGTQWTHR